MDEFKQARNQLLASAHLVEEASKASDRRVRAARLREALDAIEEADFLITELEDEAVAEAEY